MKYSIINVNKSSIKAKVDGVVLRGMDIKDKEFALLIIGNGKLASSVAVCSLLAGQRVTLVTEHKGDAIDRISSHLSDLSRFNDKTLTQDLLEITNFADCTATGFTMGIGITGEYLSEKMSVIQQLEKKVDPAAAVAINTESIPLSILQKASNHPERLVGLNWVEPAHVTFFLELIINAETNKKLADQLFEFAKIHWNKDPYLIYNNVSIRARMLSGMIREAFYLVQNGYASIEDIDRACRNDAGYYLPFAGNFRYMDLMGPYAYGLVMKDLNRELSKDAKIPPFVEEIIERGGLGMENNEGFYSYEDGDERLWNEISRMFSYQIQRIIKKNL